MHRIALSLLLASACAQDSPGPAPDDGGTGIAGGGTTTTAATGSDTSVDAAPDSSSGGPAEPDYPRPDPVQDIGSCPDGFFGPITFDGSGWLCLPPCAGDPPACPDAGSGTADAQCATNPLSTAAPCSDSTDCEVDGEMCGNIGGGVSGCLLPPSHCILRCDDGEACPDGMECATGPGICQYPADA